MRSTAKQREDLLTWGLFGVPVDRYEIVLQDFNELLRRIEQLESNKTDGADMQPIYLDEHGVVRFKCNEIIKKLVRDKTIDLSEIDFAAFPTPDVEQFFQLLGYSVSGYGDISFVRPETIAAADAKADELLERSKKEKK